MTHSRPQIVLDKQIGPEQWDIWKLAAITEELGTSGNLLRSPKNLLRMDVSQGPVIVIVTISFIIINHISYKLVVPSLLF